MTHNKLPPLPEPKGVRWRLKGWKAEGDWQPSRLSEFDPLRCPTLVEHEYMFTADQMHVYAAEALRQSQSLPAGAVAGLPKIIEQMRGYGDHEVLRWAHELAAIYTDSQRELLRHELDGLEALQADAREKGEAVVRLYPEELARMTHGPSLRLDEEDRLRSIYGDIAIPLYLHSGDYTEAMLLLEKQRELVENLRGQLDDAKADATDGCTEANCERCNTAIHSRGDMRHAGIGTYPATQPAQASEVDYPAEFKARLQAAVNAIKVPNMSPLKQELFKAGSVATINAINAALATSSQETASE